MVQLKGKAELAKSEEPKGGQSYIITKTEQTKTAVQQFDAVRVSLEPTNPKEKARLKEEEKDCATMLWIVGVSGIIHIGKKSILPAAVWYMDYSSQTREVAGVRSKLGTFLDAFTQFLGDEDEALDTANWEGHEIRIINWKEKAREVAVIK